MRLEKIKEIVSRAYVDGQATEVVTSVAYNLFDDNGIIGSVDVDFGGYHMNVNANKGSIEANLEAVREILGIED